MRFIIFLLLWVGFSDASLGQSLYFPPLTGTQWDSISPDSLNWCPEKIDSLYQFLDQENSKAFILLKDGKMVLERYFDSFTVDSNWYWASAAKGMMAFMVGQARENGQLQLTDLSSTYLGTGWTAAPAAKENQITLWHQLTMTSGLDDGVPDNRCTIDTCLTYLADAGNRWAYHNAPYTLLESTLSTATGQSLNVFTQLQVKNQTGINGFWLPIGFNNIYFSTARSFARWGLLIQNLGAWQQDTLLHDTAYFNTMLRPSQNLNPAYGYLWWLNGQSHYRVPTLQTIFPGSYAPNAPADMVAGLGANGQIVSIARQDGLVWIRMGDPPSSTSSTVPTLFCNEVWGYLNDLECTPLSLAEVPKKSQTHIFPNPTSASARIVLPSEQTHTLTFFNATGQIVWTTNSKGSLKIATNDWPTGVYWVQVLPHSEGAAPELLKLVVER